MIHLTGKDGGEVAIEPDLFFDAMVLLPIDGWQIVQESKDSITCFILRPHSTFNESEFVKRITGELETQGAKTPTVKVERIDPPPPFGGEKLVLSKMLSEGKLHGALVPGDKVITKGSRAA